MTVKRTEPARGWGKNSPWANRRPLIEKLAILDQAGFPNDPELRRLVIQLGLTFEDTRRLAEGFKRAIDAAVSTKRGRPPGWSPMLEADRQQLLDLEREREHDLSWKEIDSVADEAAGPAQPKTKRDRLRKVYKEILAARETARRMIELDNSA